MDEYKITNLLLNSSIAKKIDVFRKKYDDTSDEFKKLSRNDFLGIVLLAPLIGVALSNKDINLFEDIHLKIKARKVSEGGFFHLIDPVVEATKVFYKHFTEWESEFYTFLKELINSQKQKNDIPILSHMISVGNVQRDGRTSTKTMDTEAFHKIKQIAISLEINYLPSYESFIEEYGHLD